MSTTQVIIDFRAPAQLTRQEVLDLAQQTLPVPSLWLDPDYLPVPGRPPAGVTLPAGEALFTLRGRIDAAQKAELQRQPQVVQVWLDTPVAPFSAGADKAEGNLSMGD